MIVGVPKEIKDNENRVSLTPVGVEALCQTGQEVAVQQGAGAGSGFGDGEYRAAGATLFASAADIWRRADMIIKVKEPLPAEYGFLREGLVLFTFLHLAAEERLTRALLESKVTGIAYETVQLADGRLPLLTPMSEVAGRMAVQIGARYLEQPSGGRGVLLGGVPGVRPAGVVVLGGGTVGTNAAQIALGMGAQVTVYDVNADRLRYLSEVLHGNLITLASNRRAIFDGVRTADLVIGAALVVGARAPKLLTREMVAQMKAGAVVVDVAVDQGGCFETCRPTSHREPTYTVDGVLHYCVSNMPGAVPNTSTQALTNATLSYVLELTDNGLAGAIKRRPELAGGVNTYAGQLTQPGVAAAFGLPYTPLAGVM